MIPLESYMQTVIGLLRNSFAQRLLYVGLQGSYLRGEATENSDIDVVVILENLTVTDLSAYREIISQLDQPEKSCGFVCGREDLQNWNPLEVCNFLHGTKDYYGKLSDYLPEYSRADVTNFIKLSVGNLYHEITHRYLHGDLQKSKTKLPYAYKNVFFILQSVSYLKTGVFCRTKKELAQYLSDGDKGMMERAARLANGDAFDLEEEFSKLLKWCQEILRSL